jgi:mono/diheme cytochrome c family protein
MPVWGNVLTQEQIDALVNFIATSAQGTSVQRGQTLFADNCAPCHGDFGEGGVNPANPNQIINPIGTAEFLNTRDDTTLFQIISQGQPDQGMSPFGISNGGNLDDDQINSIVAFLRSWQANPPITTPPQVSLPAVNMSAAEIYQTICAQCHGPNGEGTIGPPLNDQFNDTDQEIYDDISRGVPYLFMPAFSSILSEDQINGLVALIRQFPPPQGAQQPTPTTPPSSGALTYEATILPIFRQNCSVCHGHLGGWNSTAYQDVMNSGNNAPVIIPGDATDSLLVQLLQGTAPSGGIMPPDGKLPAATIQTIIDWINAGAPEN